MSDIKKIKLNGVIYNITAEPDTSNLITKSGLAQSTGSATDNAMSQKAITDALATKSEFSGSYNDLTDKPTIPNEVTETTVANWGFTKNTGTYSKPSTGIPSTDMTSEVQTSLGKADTAIQDISGKQDVLVSGTNIKTINNESILGSGNITIQSGATSVKGVHSDKYTVVNKTLKTHTYFFDNTYSPQGAGFATHGTNFLQNVYNDMAQYFDTTATENIIQIIAKDSDGMYIIDIRLATLVSSGTCSGRMYLYNAIKCAEQDIKFTVSLNNNVYTISSLQDNHAPVLTLLPVQNTIAYTPTSDYHPATKKYVDDTVGDINTILENIINGGGGE